jgi:hypothetical protein
VNRPPITISESSPAVRIPGSNGWSMKSSVAAMSATSAPTAAAVAGLTRCVWRAPPEMQGLMTASCQPVAPIRSARSTLPRGMNRVGTTGIPRRSRSAR